MATLTIDLDDQATDGLEQLNAVLEQSAIAAEEAGKGADQLTAAQQRQLIVINKSVAGWSELANTSIHAFGSMGAAGIAAFSGIAATATTAAVTTGLMTSGDNLAKKAAYFAAEKAGWKAVGIAAEVTGSAALRYATGAGVAIAATETAWLGVSAILARTGKETVTLANGTRVIETNLTKVNKAASEFGHSIGQGFSEAGSAAGALAADLIKLPDIWKYVDSAATIATKSVLSGAEYVNKKYDDGVLSLRSFYVEMTTGGGEAYRKEIASLRELSDWHAKMDKQRKLEAPQFKLLADANQAAEDRAKARAEAERILSIKITSAIDDEIYKLKEKAGQDAASLEFSEDAQKQYTKTLEALEKRRADIVKENEKTISDARKKAADDYKEQMKDYKKQRDDEYKQLSELYELESKRAVAFRGMSIDEKNTGKKQDFDTQMDTVKDLHAGEKDVATARLKAQGASEIEIKAQITEMDRKFAAEIHAVKMQNIVDEARLHEADLARERKALYDSDFSGVEYEKRLSKIKADEDKLFFDLRKKGIEETGRFDREQNKLTNDLKIAGIQAQLKAEEERIQKTKAMADAIAQKFDAKGFAQQQDPQKVFKQFQLDRMKQAQAEQMERDRALATQGQNIGAPGQKAALDKFFANQKAAMQKAKNQAARDAENGNFSDGELQKAQVNVGKEVVNNAGKQGQINANTVKALNDVLTGLANTADAQDNVQATLDRLVAAAKGQKQVAKRQVENARNQANSLE